MDELPARIGDQRRAGIRDEGKGRAFAEPLQQVRAARCPIMVMVGAQSCTDAMRIKEFARDSRILGQHLVCGGKDVERTKRDISEVADRCRDNVQPGVKARALVLRAMWPGTSLAGWAAAGRLNRSLG